MVQYLITKTVLPVEFFLSRFSKSSNRTILIFFACCSLLLCAVTAKSQSTNLYFSQVLMLQTHATINSSVTYTVPANKVWKLEGWVYGGDRMYCIAADYVYWQVTQINGVTSGSSSSSIYLFKMSGASDGSGKNAIWMGAGNSIRIKTLDNSCGGAVPLNWITGIEFTVAP